MKKILIPILWIISILISIGWTFEHPEEITKFKNVLKYDLSFIEIFKSFNSKSVKKTLSSNEKVKVVQIDTAYNTLELEYFTVPVYSSYGGIAQVDDTILYLSGDSDLFLLKKNDKKKIEFKQIISTKIDNKKSLFVKNNEKKVGNYAERFFGIKDVLVDSFTGFENKLLLASSLEYNDLDDCYTMGVYYSEIVNTDIFQVSKWKNIFSTEKCLTVDLTTNPRFAAASAGGRLIKIDEDNVLLSIGDFYADGVNGPALSQDLTNMYGKTIMINIKNLNFEIFSYGHRNPQGLFIDNDNNIFSTEHGPTGGDELNFIIQNNNHGWPLATYGTNYKSSDAYIKEVNDNKKVWPLDITENTHNFFYKPLFSWGNTLGISNLIVYENNYFTKWNRNLIVSTLASKQLIRMVFDYDNKSIIYKENIKLDKRIRDIIELNDGRIALLTDRGKKLNENSEIIIINKKNIN
ncbi:PQQ-dependent sugar dehydrogenase [Candidatus Pelagibacter sp.]|nr:PQQ-dependent sugar dehydrogenase [Candidatus Pelagibacter sp.]